MIDRSQQKELKATIKWRLPLEKVIYHTFSGKPKTYLTEGDLLLKPTLEAVSAQLGENSVLDRCYDSSKQQRSIMLTTVPTIPEPVKMEKQRSLSCSNDTLGTYSMRCHIITLMKRWVGKNLLIPD